MVNINTKHVVIAFLVLVAVATFFMWKNIQGASIPLSTPTPTSVLSPPLIILSPTPFPVATISAQPLIAPTITTKLIKATYSLTKGLQPTQFILNTGQSVRFEVYAQDNGSGCMGSIMFPYLSNSIQGFVKGQTNVFEFTPDRPGEYQITCAMGIPHGTIEVKQ